MQNPNDIRGDRANCGFDHRAIFNAALVADSHFPLSGWKSLALNNWELAPLLQIHDGSPFTVTSGVDNSLTATGNDRPNMVNPNDIYTNKTLTKTNAGNRNFLNASAFAQNASGTFGDVGRNSVRGPKYVQLDAQLSRYFPIGERGSSWISGWKRSTLSITRTLAILRARRWSHRVSARSPAPSLVMGLGSFRVGSSSSFEHHPAWRKSVKIHPRHLQPIHWGSYGKRKK